MRRGADAVSAHSSSMLAGASGCQAGGPRSGARAIEVPDGLWLNRSSRGDDHLNQFSIGGNRACTALLWHPV